MTITITATERINHIASQLILLKVPMIKKTSYDDGQNGLVEWFKVKITKPDRFYRANGKIVSKVMVNEIKNVGLAVDFNK